MWRLLQNVQHNKSRAYFSARNLFLLQLFFVVFCLHILLFFLAGFISFLYRGHSEYKVNTTNKSAVYVLMPLLKKMPAHSLQNKKQSSSRKQSVIIDHKTYKAALGSKNTTAKTVVDPVLKDQSKQSSVRIANNIKKEKINASEKKKSKIAVEKKNTVKIKEIVPKKIEIKKTDKDENSKTHEAQSIKPHASEETVVTPSEMKNIEPAIHTINQENIEIAQIDSDDVLFVGYQELEQLMMSEKIAHMVQLIWQAPVGMTEGLSCKIQVQIDGTGACFDLKVVQSSGIFVYDQQAKKTLKSVQYPQEIFNKTIIITLGSA